MTRSVEDAAILLSVMAGPDQNDEITLTAPKNTPDYTKALDSNGLKGARIGIGRNYMGRHEEIDKVLELNFEIMRGLGVELIDINEIVPQSSEFNQQALTMLLYEFKDGINKYLKKATPTTGVKSLEDIIAFNIKNAERAMPYFKQERLEQAQKMGPLSDLKYVEAVKLVQSVSRESIRNLKTQHNLDAFITPTCGLPWCTDLINGDYYYGGYSAGPAAWSGFPSVSVPAGFVHGLPFGLLFFSTEYQESTLLKLAYSFEQATKHRRIPEFIQSSPH
jgi:amidase